MKELAEEYIRKVLVITFTILFLISSIISYKSKNKAQGEFARETLSFILHKENDDDFIETLEKFNDSQKKLSIIYMDRDKNIIYNPRKESLRSLKKFNKEEKYTQSADFFGTHDIRKNYIMQGKNVLVISEYVNLAYYINFNLLVFYIILAWLSYYFILKNYSGKIDEYIDGLSNSKVKYIYKEPQYAPLRPIISSFMDDIDRLEGESSMLKDRLNEFTNITSNMKEGFILFDGNGSIELINDSALRYLTIDESSNIYNLIDDKEYSLALKEASILKRSKSLDIEINGYYLRIFLDPLSTSQKKAYAMIIIDNSEQKKAEMMRREFSANVTHELKSPLTSINGYAELIASGIAKEDDVCKFAEIIHKEGNRLLEIIDDILKISRLDESNYEKDFIEVDIKDVVNSTIEKYQKISDKKNLTIKTDIESFRIKTSKSLFYDLISNIYENAIKYNKVNGEIAFTYDIRANTYYLIIKDTGIGIAKGDIPRIFERFYVVDKARKRNQKSTGLGLSIVKHIINYLEYDIKVESELGKGTEFIIEIPLELDR